MHGTQKDYFNIVERRSLGAAMRCASRIRNSHWGEIITYSRKVFIPLTNMCRDNCGYCTFVKHPDSPEAWIMTPKQVIEVARAGERNGCKEVLFSLGEKPEMRYGKARKVLESLGYRTMVSYLRDMCALILRKHDCYPTLTPER